MLPYNKQLLAGVISMSVLAGCSKKPDEAAPTQGAEQSPPTFTKVGGGQPLPPPKKPDPDTVLADYRKHGGSLDYSRHTQVTKQFREAFPPDSPRRAEAYQTIRDRAKSMTDGHREELLSFLTNYATGDDIPELVALVDEYSSSKNFYRNAVKRLIELKDQRSAPAAARWYGTRLYTEPDPDAANLLFALGTVAEPAVLPYMRKDSTEVKPWLYPMRIDCVRFLKQYGTEQSIPVLKAMLDDMNPVTRKKIEDAIATIQARVAAGKK